ncbi:MAG: hypothetical protein R2879_13475 [Saprospiraceae bacterium]
MKSVYNFRTWLLLLAAFLMAGTELSAAAKQEFTKTIKKNFPLAANGLTSLSNEYGKVYVKTWDQNRVKIDVKITVRAESEEAAQDVFEKIKIEFAEAADLVQAATKIESSSSWTWWGNRKLDYSIDYDVKIPQNGRLDLTNKYGDAFVGSINGATTLNIKYGNFQMEEAKNDLSVFLGYGSGTVISAKDIMAEGSYCQLKIKTANHVKINSKYSKVDVEEAGKIDADSQYDSYKVGYVKVFNNAGRYDNVAVGSAGDLNISSKYAEISVEELKNSANLDLKYGGAKIGKVVKGFHNINLNGSFADYKVKVEEGAHFQMQATADYAGIKYPQVLNVVHEKEKGTYHEVNGYVGQKGSGSVIKASLNYGGLKVW